MSVPGILYNIGLNLLGTSQSEAHSSIKQGKQDFEQLLEAVQKGDVSAAQQALSALQQVQAGVQGNQATAAVATDSSAANSSSALSGASPLATDFASLGTALKSGSLTSAQDAYAKLQEDLKATHRDSRQYGSLGRAAEVYSVLQQLGVTGSGDAAGSGAGSFVSAIDTVNGDVGALKQAVQSGNQSLSQDAMTRLLHDLRSSSLLGRQAVPAAATTQATA